MGRAIMVRKNIKKGSVTVEAALIIPIFFISLLTLAFTIRIVLFELEATLLVSDEAQRISIDAYENKESWQAVTAISLDQRLRKRFVKENSPRDSCSLHSFNYRFKQDGLSELIYFDISYNRKIPLPYFADLASPGLTGILFRGFVGHNPDDNFLNQIEDEEDVEVWVFPLAGERYHLEDCKYIKVCARQSILNERIRSAYSPCSLCKPGILTDGSFVYIFPNAGKVYHRGTCFIVDRYVVPMMKSEAEAEGYTACMVCFGAFTFGGNYGGD